MSRPVFTQMYPNTVILKKTKSAAHNVPGDGETLVATLERLKGFDIPLVNILRFLRPLERCFLIVDDEKMKNNPSNSGTIKSQLEWNSKIRGLIFDITKRQTSIQVGDIIPPHDEAGCAGRKEEMGGVHQSGIPDSFVFDLGLVLQEFYPNVREVKLKGWWEGTYDCGYHISVPSLSQVMTGLNALHLTKLELAKGDRSELSLESSVFRQLTNFRSLKGLNLDGVTVRNAFLTESRLAAEIQMVISPQNFPDLESLTVTDFQGQWQPEILSQPLREDELDCAPSPLNFLSRIRNRSLHERSRSFEFQSLVLAPDSCFQELKHLGINPCPEHPEILESIVRKQEKIQTFTGKWKRLCPGSFGCEDVFWALMSRSDLVEARIGVLHLSCIVGMYQGPGIEDISAKNLTKLSLAGDIHWFGDETLKRLGEFCRELEVLSLKNLSSNTTVSGWSHLGELKNLHRLHIEVTNPDFAAEILTVCGENVQAFWMERKAGTVFTPRMWDWKNWADSVIGSSPGLNVLDVSCVGEFWKELVSYMMKKLDLEVVAGPRCQCEALMEEFTEVDFRRSIAEWF